MHDNANVAYDDVAVVTGAARGLGRVVASTLARRGYRLVLVDLSPLAEAVADVESAGAAALAIRADVSSEEDVARLAAETLGHFGRADVLVNNAGVSLLKPAEETSLAEWQRVLAINLTGPFLEDVAEAVAFLADPARSGFVNGVALPVDGGWSSDASWRALRLGTRGAPG